MNTRRIAISIAATAFTLGALTAPAGATAQGTSHPVDSPQSGLANAFQSRASRVRAVRHGATGLPTWTGSLESAGTPYPYTMVGSDPSAGSATTRVPVRILPLRLTFDGGITLDGTDVVDGIRHSPIFKDADYRSGRTQYGDAMQRASFWDTVSTGSPRYHVLLSEPKVLPTISLAVPAGSGFGIETANGPAGVVTTQYLLTLAPQLFSYYDPSSLLIIVVKDVQGDNFLGFHFALTPPGQTVPMTLIFSGYFSPDVVVGPSLSDSYVLSHEVAEWINDPYATNVVPAWTDPASGSCFNNLLEVGDPVEFLPNPSFTVRSNGRLYHVTDVAGISWFAHDTISRELGGAYSYNGNLTTFSTLC